MIFQAHKGVSTENPENTMPSFVAAAAQGYKIIELDVSVTKDIKFVLLHDPTINRTARTPYGEDIGEAVRVEEITYSEAQKYDFGSWFSKKFKGTKMPLFEDVLRFARAEGIQLKIDNKHQRFGEVQKERFFELLKSYCDTAALTFSDLDRLAEASAIFSDMHFHYDGEVSEEILLRLSMLVPKDRLTVWLPLQCRGTSWVKVPFATPPLAKAVKKYARLGMWILSTYEELEAAAALGADVIETNGELKPHTATAGIADMHTHSESSHDSECKISDMLTSQCKNGAVAFAVTDHFDADSLNDYDIFSPILTSHEKIDELNKISPIPILRGIEISECPRHADAYSRVRDMTKYDVIIGSVHLVRYPELMQAYSKIDFSALPYETVLAYLDAYFDELLIMTDTIDFDILAHLTCPLRYIRGKYGIEVDMSRYAGKIEKILEKIIKRGISLEVNTSSYKVLGDFMPSRDILEKYRDMGGYLITLGSDAHVADDASLYFREATRILSEVGFKNIYYYKNRQPIQITI